MKKLLTALIAILMACCSIDSKAQILSDIEGMPPYKLGATVGLNFPSFSGSPYSSTIGVQGGLNLMVDGSEYSVNTFGRIELKYSMKGAYHENKNKTMGDMKDWYTTHYLEVPVHVGYAWYMNEDWSVMLEGGPYFAFGLWGRRRTSWSNSGIDSEEIDSFFSDLNCSRFDFGLGLQFSAMYLRDYQIHVAYDYGFINMHPSFQQNRNLSVGVTYFFE